MRIISGKYGGRRFSPPKGLSARPTTDRAKEGLFNMLQHRMDLEGIEFIDLFGGTGNISFELISRGAHGTIVERERRALNFIRQTIDELQIKELKVIPTNVYSFIQKTPKPVDLIFADPPYHEGNPVDLVNTILESDWLKKDGIMILEHFEKVTVDLPSKIDERAYGQSVFSIFAANK